MLQFSSSVLLHKTLLRSDIAIKRCNQPMPQSSSLVHGDTTTTKPPDLVVDAATAGLSRHPRRHNVTTATMPPAAAAAK